ncbi:uncharacterized protein An03g01730 [Aspergillus niger]|uniref:Contig An03c0050, genomic contig n=2 Tax=Aspergillus niger TaxID=5061 RepID=A2QG36_ASPNC|nr:uncharacterized protein An03g01730 [Aspergillus niger]CAK38146.1 unnamed protein product [Aspergillus niger]
MEEQNEHLPLKGVCADLHGDAYSDRRVTNENEKQEIAYRARWSLAPRARSVQVRYQDITIGMLHELTGLDAGKPSAGTVMLGGRGAIDFVNCSGTRRAAARAGERDAKELLVEMGGSQANGKELSIRRLIPEQQRLASLIPSRGSSAVLGVSPRPNQCGQSNLASWPTTRTPSRQCMPTVGQVCTQSTHSHTDSQYLRSTQCLTTYAKPKTSQGHETAQ